MCTNSNIVIKYDYNFKLNKTMGFLWLQMEVGLNGFACHLRWVD